MSDERFLDLENAKKVGAIGRLKLSLQRDNRQAFIPNTFNACLILARDPMLRGMLGFDEFRSQVALMRPPPCQNGDMEPMPGPYPRMWQTADALLILGFLQRNYSSRFTRATVEEAMLSEAHHHRSHDAADPPDLTDLKGFDLTEDGVALAFRAKYRGVLRYDHDRGSWYHWTGGIWRMERPKLAFSWARITCRHIGKTAKNPAALGKASAAAAVERFAQSDGAFAVRSDIWDQDSFLLGTPEGTVNLRTGFLQPPRIDDYISKCAAVAPANAATCPIWKMFLEEATGGDRDLIQFLQSFCGYTLTADTREHALLFIYGPGGNGKSVFLNTLVGILGDYCQTAAMETFTASASDRHPTDLAMLRGARMVCSSETEEGRAWAETRLKQLTGGDPISARFMRQDFFTFTPLFKLCIIGNHKPILRNVDDAARRRLNLAPFVHRPTQPNRHLEADLRAEWPGILRWMIEGCLIWQRDGLVRPKVVVDATAEYFSEQDLVSQWIEDCCDRGHTLSDTAANLFKSWSEFALANGEKPGTAKWFSQVLARLGAEPVKRLPGNRTARGWVGIQVKLFDTSTQWQNRSEK